MSPAQENTTGYIKHNWLAVIMLAIGSFSIINTEFLPIGLLSDIAQFYHISTGQAGLIVTVPGVTAAFAAPLLMLFSGRFDRKIILIAMIFLVMLSNMTIYVSDNFILSLVSRFFLGIAIGGFWSFSIPFGVSLVSQDKRSKATAIVTAGIAAGTVAGVPLGTFLGVTFGWKNAFLVNGVFTLVVFLLQLLVLPAKKAETRINARIMWEVLIQKAVSQRIICAILFGSAHFTAFTYYEPMVMNKAHLPAALLPTLLLIYGVAGFIGTFLADKLIGLFTARGTFRLSAALLTGAVILFYTIPLNAVDVGVLTFIWGAAFGLMPVSINVWLFEASEKDFEISSALNVTAFQVAIATGSFIGGLLVGSAGVSMPFILGSVTGVLCVLVTLVKVNNFNIEVESCQ